MGFSKKKLVRTTSVAVLLIISLTLHIPYAEFQTQISRSASASVISNESTREYWPTDGWRNSTPEEHGMSARILNDMMDFIEAQEYPIDSVLIIKDGYAVLEEYPGEFYTNRTLHAQHSVGKSVVSVLLGVAFLEGMLADVSQHALDFFPEYDYLDLDSGWENITIEHLLTMTPGFEWDEWSYPYVWPSENPIMNMMYSTDAVEFILNRSMVYEPGEFWGYNGGASTLLGAIIQKVYDDQLYYVFRNHLFNHIGIDYYSLPVLPGGWYNVMGGFGLRTIDMAKIGFLYLNNGTWNGTQIVPTEFVTNSIASIEHPNPLGPQFGYGWHWWLRFDLGIYFAYGRHGQKIMISSEHDMVVVFTASIGDDEYDPEFDLFEDYVLRSISVGPDSDNQLGISPEVFVTIVVMGSIAFIAVAITITKRRN